MLVQAPKGTRDILPSEIHIWQELERKFFTVAGNFGYREIRTPVFEYTEIFNSSVGDTTDIVQKEMYTFNDKGGRSITLRPEGTAGIVRSFVENGLSSEPAPQKLAYGITAYRYENVAKGRYREFHQFGVEAFSARGPAIDAEIISLADLFLRQAGLSGFGLEINSIGCSKCRPGYNEALKEYFSGHMEAMCRTCVGRLATNPLRILDCKEESCIGSNRNAPSVLDHLCEECDAHFTMLKKHLDSLGIEYSVNDRIVRGLDYYTKTVFEFVSGNVGAQGTICGGGRYDSLVGRFSGNDLPGIGFAIGVERLIMQAEAEKSIKHAAAGPLIYLASIGQDAALAASALALKLRAAGIHAEYDAMDRSLKAQLKHAGRTGASYALVLGDDELSSGIAQLKDMTQGTSKTVKLDNLIDELTGTEEYICRKA